MEANALVKAASFYEGEIKNLLVHLRDAIHFQEPPDKAQALVMEIEHRVEESEKWLAALVKDLSQASALHTNALDEFGYINQAIAREEEAKEHYSDILYLEAGDLFAYMFQWPQAGRCYKRAIYINETKTKEKILSDPTLAERYFKSFAAVKNWQLAIECGLLYEFGRVDHLNGWEPRFNRYITPILDVLKQNGLRNNEAYTLIGELILSSLSLILRELDRHQIAEICFRRAGNRMRAKAMQAWLKEH